MGNWTNWELSAGMFPGLLFGIRSYDDGDFQVDHVLYIGIFDVCLTLYYEE
jgi:hypothetical protein